MGTGAGAWKPEVETLSSDRDVHSVSLPGYDGTAGPFSMASAVRRVRESVEAAPASAPVALSGFEPSAPADVIEESHRFDTTELLPGLDFPVLAASGERAQVG